MSTVIVGIDPGADGGVALLLDRKPLFVLPMPTEKGVIKGRREVDVVTLDLTVGCILKITTDAVPVMVFVEKVGPFPGSSATSAFTFGRNFESVITWLKLRKYSFQLVDPRTWKKEVLSGTDRTKDAAIAWVHHAFPELKEKVGRHDGMCDALCIAEYGRRLNK